MASGGTEELERPASFKWEHFEFPVKYNDEGKKLVDKTDGVSALWHKKAIWQWKHIKHGHRFEATSPRCFTDRSENEDC